jgi:hypothetical protein
MRLLPIIAVLACAGLLRVSPLCADEVSPAEPPAEQQTYQEILAARAAPDLDRLVERSLPDVSGPDATESFWDLLKLRELPDPKAVPVLEKVLVENLPTTRIHGFAAAQALFCIGTPEAHKILKRHLQAEGSRAESAIMYTSHWEMREPKRSRSIERYLLKNLSSSLVVKLERQEPADPVEGQIALRLILRNASDETFHLVAPQDRPHLLYLRDEKHRYIPQYQGATICPGPSNIMELKPGQTHSTTLTVVTAPNTAGQIRDASAKAVVAVQGSADQFAVTSLGRFEFVALIEAAPLNAAQREHLKVDDAWTWWSGRAVSAPLAVDLALPDAPDPPSSDK